MGAFICAISERDWPVSRTKGIYGNKIGRTAQNGSYTEFSDKTKYSIVRDLVGMRKGDKVFFHVLTKPSGVHGVYVVRETPFFDSNKIWEDPNEVFPYRFLFEPHPQYTHLCNQDANTEVLDFYELIEQRKIWSLATLENERNIEARSVRKIQDGTEPGEILRLLHRDYRQRRRTTKTNFKLTGRRSKARRLRDYIKDIGRFENSIKALLMYRIGEDDPGIASIFGSVSDFMNEVFIAQTRRKSIDILLIADQTSRRKTYTICEVKTKKCDSGSLAQVLLYMDLFPRKEVVNVHSDVIRGCLIGQSFESEVLDYVRSRNNQGVDGKVLLVEYKPILNGKDATFKRVA